MKREMGRESWYTGWQWFVALILFFAVMTFLASHSFGTTYFKFTYPSEDGTSGRFVITSESNGDSIAGGVLTETERASLTYWKGSANLDPGSYTVEGFIFEVSDTSVGAYRVDVYPEAIFDTSNAILDTIQDGFGSQSTIATVPSDTNINGDTLATQGTDQDMRLKTLRIEPTGNDTAVVIIAPAGGAIYAEGGNASHSVEFNGTASGGSGLRIKGGPGGHAAYFTADTTGASASGLVVVGYDEGSGFQAQGGDSGAGATFIGGDSSGHGMIAQAQKNSSSGLYATSSDGNGITAYSSGGNGHGISATETGAGQSFYLGASGQIYGKISDLSATKITDSVWSLARGSALISYMGACDSCYQRLYPEGGTSNKDSVVIIDPSLGADSLVAKIIFKHGTTPSVYDTSYFYIAPWW